MSANIIQITENQKKLLKKVKRKAQTTHTAVNLLRYNSKTKIEKQYQRAIKCGDQILCQDGILKQTFYCDLKFCKICSNIRTAKNINKYKPQIEEIEQKTGKKSVFLTLTRQTIQCYNVDEIKAVKKENLKFFSFLRKNIHRDRKNNPQSIFKYYGIIRNEEKHFNENNHLHLHYHLICTSIEIAQYVMNEWVEWHNKQEKDRCNINAQNIQNLDEKGFLECFKYSTKLEYKSNNEEKEEYYKNLNIIFEADNNQKLMVVSGDFSKPIESINPEDLKADIINDFKASDGVYIFDLKLLNYINAETGEFLINLPELEKFQIDFRKHCET